MSFIGKRVLMMVVIGGLVFMPTIASAETMSVTQVITVTATVAPARSIVVNDAGQMIKIYSNTDEDVAPKVYLNEVPGQERPLTPELLSQYNELLDQTPNKVGVTIPVVAPANKPVDERLVKLLPLLPSTFSFNNLIFK